MPACLASSSTASQPDSTTGENAMTSTPWAMYERIAWIWFSCFCCASENLRSKPFSAVSVSWMDFVLAARQPDSAPTCEKPTTIASPLPPSPPASLPPSSVPPPPLLHAASARTATPARTPVRRVRALVVLNMLSSLRCDLGAVPRVVGSYQPTIGLLTLVDTCLLVSMSSGVRASPASPDPAFRITVR